MQKALALGEDVNSADHLKRTALMAAVMGGHESIVRLLIEQPGIDLNLRDSLEVEANTALHHAVLEGQNSILRVLLQQPQLDVNLLNDRDHSPLMTSVYKTMTNIYSGIVERDLKSVSLLLADPRVPCSEIHLVKSMAR